MSKPKTTISKARVLFSEVENWHNVFIDKSFGKHNIVYKFRNGIEVECRPRSTDINEAVVVISGIEYPKSWCVLDSAKNNIVFDIGANIGTFSIYIAKLNLNKALSIHAFEPHPENMALTKINLERNNVSNYLLVQKAISANEGVAAFDISGAYDSFRLNDMSEHSLKVETVSLSHYCHSQSIKKIDILKMDIEGGEYAVFEKDIDFIRQNVEKLLVEYHNIEVKDGGEVIRNLLGSDFDVTIQNPHDGGGMLLAKRR